jgi:hypothetical protein
MNIPFWFRLSLVICIWILIADWFSGESTRKLDSEFLLDRIRDEMQRTTGLLARLVAESAVVGDDGFYVAEWQKRPTQFG